MSKNLKKIIFGFVLLLFTVLYTYYFRTLVDDELYNYGFSYSIINGLVPYKDFNMIIMPLFNYLLAVILWVFGSKLLVYHFVLAFLLVGIFFISYESIGKRAFLIYFLLLIYPYVGYNLFILLLLFILFYINDKDKTGILEPILISMMFLTKQTLGLLVIPSLIYSKNRKKTLFIYLVFILAFFIYLIGNDIIVEFFDYCLFGLFDFVNKNSTSVGLLTVVELLIIAGLGYYSYITKRKDILFCLIFQVIALPIVNYIHFIVSFVPVMYLFFKNKKNENYISFFLMVVIVSYFLSFNIPILLRSGEYKYSTYYDVDNFMRGRVVSNFTEDAVLKVKEYIDNYSDYEVYIFGRFSYTFKLNLDLPITKYDIINNGNMGYSGANKYIEEIDDYCDVNKCLFIINDNEENISITVQTNSEILNYVKSNYGAKYISNSFSIYTN